MTELQKIQNKIYEVRATKVMFDFDLAELYQVETRVLNQAVKRNIKRFPADFMFQLSSEEWEILKSQFVMSSWGGMRRPPYAFTEQGLAMLSGVLKSDVAIAVNISIMRAFVALRKFIASATETTAIAQLKNRLEALEEVNEETLRAINDLSEDTRKEFAEVYTALSEIISKQEEDQQQQRKPIGFQQKNKK